MSIGEYAARGSARTWPWKSGNRSRYRGRRGRRASPGYRVVLRYQNRLIAYVGDFMRVQTARTDTADRILDLAERLVQTRGFNGFSYADIASELGVTKASLHYHFPTKAELGRCLINRYGEAFAQALADIDADSSDAREKLRRYANLYARVLGTDR